jgi:hypothetical protein
MRDLPVVQSGDWWSLFFGNERGQDMPRLAHLDVEFDALGRKLQARRIRGDHVTFGWRDFGEDIQPIGVGGGGALDAQGLVAQRQVNAGNGRILFVLSVPADKRPILTQTRT